MFNHLFVDLWFKIYDTGSTKIDHTKNAGCLHDLSIANEVLPYEMGWSKIVHPRMITTAHGPDIYGLQTK